MEAMAWESDADGPTTFAEFCRSERRQTRMAARRVIAISMMFGDSAVVEEVVAARAGELSPTEIDRSMAALRRYRQIRISRTIFPSDRDRERADFRSRMLGMSWVLRDTARQRTDDLALMRRWKIVSRLAEAEADALPW